MKKLFFLKRFLQVFLFFLSLFLIAEGLWGNQLGVANLSTQWVWVHYRGLLILSLLFVGNIFCSVCPFIFFRDLLRVFIKPRFNFPKRLRNKWLVTILFIFILFCYEAFSLWSSPYQTALLIISFFIVAASTDSLFKHASFCKYICPIGHFNFLTSTLSPREIKIKKESICSQCKSIDCIKGNQEHRGCELQLYLPKKKGNLDCTFCLDCVKACPSENIILSKVLPAKELEHRNYRSGIGNLEKRSDYLFAITSFLFIGLLNAFLMTSPAFKVQEFLSLHLHLNPKLQLGLLFFLFTIILPFFLFYLPFKLLKHSSANAIISSIPLSAGLWCAHYSFHFLTGLFAFVPLLGISLSTKWMGLSPGKVQPLEFGFLIMGLIMSFLLVNRKEKRLIIKAYSTLLFLFLGLCCIGVLLVPMQMRGTFVGLP